MKLLVCAMETSSNVHLKELKKHLNDDVELLGVFDKELGKPLYDLTHLAIMGFVDAIKKLRFFFRLRDELVDLAKDCDKVLLMDSSGFNLPLAKKLKQKYPSVDTLSLGMSSDLGQAIAHGSTMVRIGTAIFGERTNKI